METTCNRCHQGIPAESCFCPTCGLPQLVYNSDENGTPAQPERWDEVVRDAATVEWRTALKSAIAVGVPAGLLSSGESPVSFLCLFWMAGAAVWAVNLYVRKQRPAWITVGAGARIGLVTGLLGGWFAFAVSGASMAASRFLFGGAKDIDGTWKSIVDQVSARWQEMSPDPQTSQIFKQMAAWLLTPQGHAGSILGSFLTLECGLLIFAAAGGAIGARLLARSRQPKG